MKRLFTLLTEKQIIKESPAVLLSNVVHDDKPVYKDAGYGAQPIPKWPFYEFIKLYTKGFQNQCVDKWSVWLFGQFSKYKLIPKRKGGMFQGSVHRFAAEESKIETLKAIKFPDLLNSKDILYGAQKLINQRLKMVESIRVNGYIPKKGEKILALKKNNKIVLKGGHHRAATLKALGYKKLPEVLIVPKCIWRIRKCVRLISKT